MPHKIRLWSVRNGNLVEVVTNKPEFEEYLENWLEKDISMVSDNLIVIGRQVTTLYGKRIDLLCLNQDGDVIILELKREKTPREVIAQVLDYASWIDTLSYEDIVYIADEYLEKKGTNLENVFREKFGKELPEVINESHEIIIVASELDDQTERVIEYLSKYGIRINAAIFNYFKDGDREYLARIWLVPESVEERRGRGGKRKPSKLWTPNLLKEAFNNISDERLKNRLFKLLEFAEENDVFAESRAQTPAFSLKTSGGIILSISSDDSLYAYFGVNERKKFPSDDIRYMYVKDLKDLGLLPQDLNPNDIKSGKILSKKLSTLTDSEFQEFLRRLKRYLIQY